MSEAKDMTYEDALSALSNAVENEELKLETDAACCKLEQLVDLAKPEQVIWHREEKQEPFYGGSITITYDVYCCPACHAELDRSKWPTGPSAEHVKWSHCPFCSKALSWEAGK